jgi:hypothetical protein
MQPYGGPVRKRVNMSVDYSHAAIILDLQQSEV